MLRFKNDDGSSFPDWKEKKLEDVCEYRKGQNVGVNYVGTENMNQNFSGVDSLDSTNEVKGVTYCVGDTLMSNIRPYLKKTWKADRNGVCSTDVLVFRPVNIDSDFLYCNIASEKFVSYVMTGVKGSKMPRGDKKHIMEYDIPVPSLPEQQKIAEFLSTIDTVIEKQKETVSAWEERKKGVMQKLFSQEVRFKADDGSNFPDWEEKKIDDVATCFAGATPSTKIPEYWEEGTIRWMSSGEVNNGQIHDTEKRISELGFDKCSTKMVKPNSVVMALAGQGKTRGMVAITRVPLCTNQSLCAIETNDDICDDYLYQYLQTQYNNLRLISSGDGTRGGLNLKLVGGYVVVVPCLAEQQKIADCLSSLDEVIERQKATLAAWEELKKGLLQQMFV